MAIKFFYEDIDSKALELTLDQSDKIKSWVSEMIGKEEFTLENLSYIFCSDTYLHQMNKEYLDHDTFTDIITFDNSELENTIDSDIFISIDRVKENSQLQKTSFKDELNRVMIHGVLHLMGWGDKTEVLKKQMRLKEDACLSLRN